MPHKTHHIQSMYYQSNQWMLSNVSVWWQNVVTMMYSLQWGIASYHLAVRYCSLQGLLGQKTEGIVLPGMAHSMTSVFTLSLQWYPHSQTKSLMKGSIDRLLCPLTWICVMYMMLSSYHNFLPIFCDFSCTKTCQSCPALNIICFLTAFLALSESPDQWRRDAATERGIPRLVAVSLHHCWMPFHWTCDPRVKKCKKAKYIVQKTPVWENWWLFCYLSIVF